MLIRRRDPAQETVVPVVVMRRWRAAAITFLLLFGLAATTALYCRAEWLATARDRNKQCDIAYAAEISADYWFRKYYLRARTRPGATVRDVHREMAARHEELRRKVRNVAGR